MSSWNSVFRRSPATAENGDRAEVGAWVNGAKEKKTEAWKLRGMQKVLTDLADNGWGQGGKSNCDDKLLPRPSWDANWPLDRAEPVFLS